MIAKTTTTAIAALLLAAPAFADDAATADDPVVATINGTEVHRAEVELIAQGLPQQMQNVPLEQMYPMLLDRLIDFKLVEAEAEKQNIGEDPEIQEALAQARSNVMRQAMLHKQVEEGASEDVVKARYEEMKQEEGFSYEEVHARHILLETEDDAKAVIADLEGGADFVELAKEKSTGPSGPQGGDLGYFKKGAMVPEFETAAFEMEVGTSSPEPIKTQFGFHIIKVEDKRFVEPSLEETEPQIRDELARTIVNAFLDDLREGAEIERFNMDGTPMIVKEGEEGAEGEVSQPEGDS